MNRAHSTRSVASSSALASPLSIDMPSCVHSYNRLGVFSFLCRSYYMEQSLYVIPFLSASCFVFCCLLYMNIFRDVFSYKEIILIKIL